MSDEVLRQYKIEHHVSAIYCDGGVIGRNPSPYGGTFAWIGVDYKNEIVVKGSGTIPGRCTNNISEFTAAVEALEYVRDGWSGKLCSDSQITLGRLCWGWALTGLPLDLIKRGAAQIKRLGAIEPVLLQGHPTKADLAAGVSAKRGYPVSIFNVECDLECQRLARTFLAQLNQ